MTFYGFTVSAKQCFRLSTAPLQMRCAGSRQQPPVFCLACLDGVRPCCLLSQPKCSYVHVNSTQAAEQGGTGGMCAHKICGCGAMALTCRYCTLVEVSRMFASAYERRSKFFGNFVQSIAIASCTVFSFVLTAAHLRTLFSFVLHFLTAHLRTQI